MKAPSAAPAIIPAIYAYLFITPTRESNSLKPIAPAAAATIETAHAYANL